MTVHSACAGRSANGAAPGEVIDDDTSEAAAPAALVRPRCALDRVLGRLGSLEVRLATTPEEIRQAQRLRYAVFYEELAAAPSGLSRMARRDLDGYDAICDHLLVLDRAPAKK